MSEFDEIGEKEKDFLLALFELAEGDPSAQVSVGDIGDRLGIDRQEASAVSEDLMGLGLVDVRTLSGGIGMSEDGVSAARQLGAGGGPQDEGERLGSDPVMSEAVRRAVGEVTDGLKCQSGKLGLDYDPLTELMADLRTIDAQLTSSRPKTAVIRECLLSIRSLLGTGLAPESTARIDYLTGG
jgi:hypothetical protein